MREEKNTYINKCLVKNNSKRIFFIDLLKYLKYNVSSYKKK